VNDAEHFEYLESIFSERLISAEVLDFAKEAWIELKDAGFPLPSACSGPDRTLLYAWDNGCHHLELEFFADNNMEFFYLNRENDSNWIADYLPEFPLPQEVLDKLQYFKENN